MTKRNIVERISMHSSTLAARESIRLRRCSQFVYKEQDPARALVEWFSARTTRHLEAISKLARVHHTPEMLAHWVMTGEGSPFFDLLAVCHRYANHSRVPSDGLLDDLATAAERACSYAP